MKKNDLMRCEDNIIRILKIEDDEVFIVDCVKKSMPRWIKRADINRYRECSADDLFALTNIVVCDIESLDALSKRKTHERYSLIAGVLPFIDNENKRSEAITIIARDKNISKQTIRNYLYKYLAYQDISILAPKSKTKVKELSSDEKNMRWALNKFFYTSDKNSLNTAYQMMLKEKYCDSCGSLVSKFPTFHQFRYFYRKYRKMQNFYISRNGLKNYQRNNRPLLGDGVQSFAPSIGVGMLDSTICDIYLVNEGGNLVGRPILTACVDAFSGMCCGYSLSWEGGVYSLKSLMSNVITNNDDYTERYLQGGNAIVAYNPDDVYLVWLIEKGEYIPFQLIESRFNGKSLTQVETLLENQKKLINESCNENLQAKINLVTHIETIANSTSTSSDVSLKNIRKARQREQMKTHKDFMKGGNNDMQICTKHKCKLVNSSVIAKSEQTFTLCPTESYIADQKPVIETDSLKVAFAQYMVDVFNAPINFEKDIPISAVLYHGMQGTKYIKSTGKTRYTKQLAEDIHSYYTRLDICDIASMSQIQRMLLGGDRFDFSVVCQIAFYLGMDVENLTNPVLTAEQIEQEQSTHYMKDRPAIDWAVYDAETAPILERVAKSIYDGTSSETGRLERVSEKIIYREMGFPGHRLENLPLCKAVFDKYSESYEENWARRIVWGYKKLKANNVPFYWSDIRKITGVKKKNINAVIPHLKKHIDYKTLKEIENLIMNP